MVRKAEQEGCELHESCAWRLASSAVRGSVRGWGWLEFRNKANTQGRRKSALINDRLPRVGRKWKSSKFNVNERKRCLMLCERSCRVLLGPSSAQHPVQAQCQLWASSVAALRGAELQGCPARH